MTLVIPGKSKYFAGIALFTMLLLCLSPLVSKTLLFYHLLQPPGWQVSAQHTQLNQSLPDAAHHHHQMPGMMMADDMGDLNTSAHQSTDFNPSADSGDVCGYCDLLIHVPIIIWFFIPFIWLLYSLSPRPRALPVHLALIQRPFPPHNPRAPPA